MQGTEKDGLRLLSQAVAVKVPAGLEARILRSCRFRLFEESSTRAGNIVQLAAVCVVANIALGVLAFQTHSGEMKFETSPATPVLAAVLGSSDEMKSGVNLHTNSFPLESGSRLIRPKAKHRALAFLV